MIDELDELMEMEDKIFNFFLKLNFLGVIYDEIRLCRCYLR